MKKTIIPRKDHEVYFLPKPETIKNNKQLQQYINENMEKLHPVFSLKSKIDIKQIYINNSRWLMITVIEEEILAEYRIINNNSFLFTNTSIMVQKKDFIDSGIHIVDDEKIGFDTEKNEPVSVPLDEKNNSELQKLKEELKTVSVRYALFNKKLPPWSIPLISACLPILLLILIFFINNNAVNDNGKTKANTFHQPKEFNQTETIIPEKLIPPSIEILASISADVVNAGGKILQWQCNIDIIPFMIIQIQGIDILNIYNLFSRYNYAILQDIQEIRYGNNEPYITVSLNIDKAEYVLLPINIFPMHDLAFNMITEFSSALLNNDISIISEILPAAGNGYMAYSINFSTTGRSLINSLEIISTVCNKYKLLVKDLSINISNNRFIVLCTLAYCNNDNFSDILLGDEKSYIPLAFGYRRNESVPEVIEYITLDAADNKGNIIGSIKDDSGIRTFFRNTADGKIQIREE